jgi:hypothetical protein
MTDYMTVIKRKYTSPTGLPFGALGPSPDAYGNSKKIRDVVMDPEAKTSVSVAELLDHNAVFLSYMAIGMEASEALFLVLNSKAVTTFRICGAAMSAMILGEVLDPDASLEVYVTTASKGALLMTLYMALPGFSFPLIWDVDELVLKQPGNDHTIRIACVSSVDSLHVAEIPFMSTGVVKDEEGYHGEVVDLTLVLHGGVSLLKSCAHRHFARFTNAGYEVRLIEE